MSQKKDATPELEPREPIIIVLLGVTGSGKSTFIKQVTGQDVPIGDNLESQTSEVKTYKTKLFGKEVWFIDTPGFNDTNNVERSDTVVLEAVTKELVKQHHEGRCVNGVIYLHKITDDKMYGSNLQNLRMLQALVGPVSLRNVTIATTKWDMVSQAEGENRERQLKEKYWKSLTAFGAKVARIHREDKDSYMDIVKDAMKNMGLTLQIVDEIGSGKSLEETEAGRVLLDSVKKLTEALRKEMQELAEELKKTKKNDEEQLKLLQEMLKDQRKQP
ncbi:P-loop containing nucleoside triphosphate hydrolase protein [Xylariaceae sp. FL0594]|nr:P-loop containing nucleoside triphosphate hydrolase protein [Xylariaceae sp. FL0594]